jgi:protein-S-isoprenylcysteine O-methyltransferase Ste14
MVTDGMFRLSATRAILILTVLMVARIRADEALLESQFGEEYAAYRRRTWRLFPGLY